MPRLARRQSDREGSTLPERPSMSPALASFLSPSRLRLPQRLYSQSPPTQKTALETSLPSTSPSPAVDTTLKSSSPPMSRPRNGAMEAIANWLAVRPSTCPIERPATVPLPTEPAALEPVPAMLRFPPKDPNEITHSPHCIDCAYRHGHTQFRVGRGGGRCCWTTDS